MLNFHILQDLELLGMLEANVLLAKISLNTLKKAKEQCVLHSLRRACVAGRSRPFLVEGFFWLFLKNFPRVEPMA